MTEWKSMTRQGVYNREGGKGVIPHYWVTPPPGLFIVLVILELKSVKNIPNNSVLNSDYKSDAEQKKTRGGNKCSYTRLRTYTLYSPPHAPLRKIVRPLWLDIQIVEGSA